MTAQAVEPTIGTNSPDGFPQQISQPHLAKQDASAVDPSKLTALSPEVVRDLKRSRCEIVSDFSTVN
jgi:hypothetical protein